MSHLLPTQWEPGAKQGHTANRASAIPAMALVVQHLTKEDEEMEGRFSQASSSVVRFMVVTQD